MTSLLTIPEDKILTIQEDEVYENPKKKVKSNINRKCNICNESNGLIKYEI